MFVWASQLHSDSCHHQSEVQVCFHHFILRCEKLTEQTEQDIGDGVFTVITDTVTSCSPEQHHHCGCWKQTYTSVRLSYFPHSVQSAALCVRLLTFMFVGSGAVGVSSQQHWTKSVSSVSRRRWRSRQIWTRPSHTTSWMTAMTPSSLRCR